jgi:hypothetical protein
MTVLSSYVHGSFTLASYGYLTITPTGGIAGVFVDGNAALILRQHATAANGGHIIGGNAKYGVVGGGPVKTGYVGQAAVDLTFGDRLTNTGTIIGGNGGEPTPAPSYYAGGGGYGVRALSASVINTGLIAGGTGGPNNGGGDGGGGGGISMVNGDVSNGGTIDGGDASAGKYGGRNGGHGVVISNGYSTNTGTIAGGHGSGENSINAAGGNGVIQQHTTLVNSGSISGGQRGDLEAANGIGVDMNQGGAVINRANASITGQYGIRTSTGAMTITNYGTISGITDAVLFKGLHGRLIEEGAAVLLGDVVGGGGTLELGAAAGAGTISGLGSAITGFSKIVADEGAGWHFAGANTIAAGETLTTSSGIVIDGALIDDGRVSVGAAVQIGLGDALTIGAGGTLLLTSDTNISPRTNGTTTSVVNDGVLEKSSGAGTSQIRSTITNNGLVEVLSGTLTFAGAVFGEGSVRIGDATAYFETNEPWRVTFLAGDTGTLKMKLPQDAFPTLTGFSTVGGSAIDLSGIVATKATYSGTATSGILTVTGGKTARIRFVGDYLGVTWDLSSDGGNGTIVRAGASAPAATAAPLVAAMASFGSQPTASSAPTVPGLAPHAIRMLVSPHLAAL